MNVNQPPVSASSTSQSLHVVMLVSSYPQSSDDNASIFLRHLAHGLHERGVVVHILTPMGSVSGTTVENGVIVHRFRYFLGRWQSLAYGSGIMSNLKQRPLRWLQIPFFLVAMTYSLLRLLRGLPRPCVIHAHWVVPQGVIAILAKWVYGLPVVTTAHGADAFTMNSSPLRWLKRECLRRCDAWTANTRVTAEAFGSANELPAARIIPMGVHFKDFAGGNRNRLRDKLEPDSHVVLFVGRLVEKKGVDDLLLAFAALPQDLRLNTWLWIVGDGHLMPHLQKLAGTVGVRHRTEFFGSIPNHQLRDYYAAADLFVGPSVVAGSGDAEGQGVVFLEAFAAHVCVVASRSGGVVDVIQDNKTGSLVEPRNPKQLAEVIEKLLRDGQRRRAMADNAYQQAKLIYDWGEIVPRFEELYRDLVHLPKQN